MVGGMRMEDGRWKMGGWMVFASSKLGVVNFFVKPEGGKGSTEKDELEDTGRKYRTEKQEKCCYLLLMLWLLW